VDVVEAVPEQPQGDDDRGVDARGGGRGQA
jgi:hypothetical protein